MGIAWQGTKAEVDSFIRRHGLTFSNVLDSDGSIFASFGVASQPAWVFQDAEGKREVVAGALAPADVAERLSDIS